MVISQQYDSVLFLFFLIIAYKLAYKSLKEEQNLETERRICTYLSSHWSNWVMLRVNQGQDEHWRPEGYRKRGLLDSVCDCNQALCYVLLHAQDMPGQAAHDSTQTESAALNVSINAPTHLVSKSNLQNFRPMFPNRPHWLPKVSLKTWFQRLMVSITGQSLHELACIQKEISCF